MFSLKSSTETASSIPSNELFSRTHSEGSQQENSTEKSDKQRDKISTDINFLYRFPVGKKITLKSGKTVDISGLSLDLTEMFRGGIDWGSGGAKMSARAMEAFGHSLPVFNMPLCIEGYLTPDFEKIEVISTEDKVVKTSLVRNLIADNLESGFTHFYIPLHLTGHASLVSFVIVAGKARVKFYDSLSPKVLSYEERYEERLMNFLKKLLPEDVCLSSEQPQVLHLLCQGGNESSGGGYYTLYTAKLLMDNEELRYLESYQGPPILNAEDDVSIRAELAVRTILEHGIESVDLSCHALIQQPREGLFSRLGREQKRLVSELHRYTSEDLNFYHVFPEGKKIILKSGKTVDISGLTLDLTEMFRGGINWGSGGVKMSTRAMEAFGHSLPVFNMPLCIEGHFARDFEKIEVISTEDKVVNPSIVRSLIADSLEAGFTHFHLPLHLSGHASLVSFVIAEGKAHIKFYDSLSPRELSYEERYEERLMNFLKSLLPADVRLSSEQPQVLHLLSQGGKESCGCGYYTLHTAKLLTDNEELRHLESYQGPPILSAEDDVSIRAELAVRTILEYGIERIDLSLNALCRQVRDGLFSRLGREQKRLVKELQWRLAAQKIADGQDSKDISHE